MIFLGTFKMKTCICGTLMPDTKRTAQCNRCWAKEHRARVKARAVAALGGKCVLCGYDRCDAALVFHHLDPTQKSFRISGSHWRGWEKVEAEIKKCVLLCHNCHHEIHAGIATL